ncbi:MAG: DDE-type integrase/transposase/recombinase [Methylobacter sp.]
MATRSTGQGHNRQKRCQYHSYQGTLKEDTSQEIEIRQIKYRNNPGEQDHRSDKRIFRSIVGFKSFRSARITLQGVELMHMIKKDQVVSGDSQSLSAAEQFYSLAAKPLRVAPNRARKKLTRQNRKK